MFLTSNGFSRDFVLYFSSVFLGIICTDTVLSSPARSPIVLFALKSIFVHLSSVSTTSEWEAGLSLLLAARFTRRSIIGMLQTKHKVKNKLLSYHTCVEERQSCTVTPKSVSILSFLTFSDLQLSPDTGSFFCFSDTCFFFRPNIVIFTILNHFNVKITAVTGK